MNGRCKDVVVFWSPDLVPLSKVSLRDNEGTVPAPKHWLSKYEMKFKMDTEKGSNTWKE